MKANKLFTQAYEESRRYWHLACNYERLNPNNSELAFSEKNPHLNNYRKSLAKLKEVSPKL